MIKCCYRCKKEKEEVLFKKDYRKNTSTIYSNLCLECCKKEFKLWRTSNKDVYNYRSKVRRTERKIRAIKYKGNICNDCKQIVHHSAFDFHHIDSKTKHKDPGLMMSHSDKDLFKELDKCILLCANCHRVRHFNEGY